MENLNIFVNIVLLLITIQFALNNEIQLTKDTKLFKKNVQLPSYIDFTVMKEPKNLFIGRCSKDDKLLHSENIILLSDKKGQVNATIAVYIDGPVKINCVKILDGSINGTTGYPYFIDGGVGYNHVKVGVVTGFGEGFNFYFEIKGYGTSNGKNNSQSEVYVNSV